MVMVLVIGPMIMVERHTVQIRIPILIIVVVEIALAITTRRGVAIPVKNITRHKKGGIPIWEKYADVEIHAPAIVDLIVLVNVMDVQVQKAKHMLVVDLKTVLVVVILDAVIVVVAHAPVVIHLVIVDVHLVHPAVAQVVVHAEVRVAHRPGILAVGHRAMDVQIVVLRHAVMYVSKNLE